MDRYAAADFLGISLRSLQRYVKDKKISATYVDGSPEFSEEELLRFRERKQEPTYRPAIAPKSDTALSPPVAPEYLSEGLEYAQTLANSIKGFAQYYELAAIGQKLTLTLTEAARISGLSKTYLNANLIAGYLRGQKLGKGWKIRPKDLKDFVDDLFNDT